jgi:enoyl-CoA hydratase/carnithine racemase
MTASRVDGVQAPDILSEVVAGVGFITLNRPRALNALNLAMVRRLTEILLAWRSDSTVHGVAIRGTNKDGPFGGFCAGGDIRFFHQAATAGDPALEDFFTEEYALNHLIFSYPKPYIAFMDGIVMGGGMGISQGASVRLVTERTKMAMPETNIGLFPDVGGGHFLGSCPGRVGEYMALTGHVIGGAQAVAWNLADLIVPSQHLHQAWEALEHFRPTSPEELRQLWSRWCEQAHWNVPSQAPEGLRPELEAAFALRTVSAIVAALEEAGTQAALETAGMLRHRSPLMLHVVLEQLRRARGMTLADDLRMERDLVRHCFFTRHLGRSGAASETVEGIRALAVDKDHTPRWNPARIEDVTPEMVAPFFDSPWPAHMHPLRHLD